MTVGDRIKMRRIELEWSQEDLAKRAGYYGKPTISKYENAGNDISMKQVSKIAKALGVTTAYLMGWETAEDQVKAEPPAPVKKSDDNIYVNANDIPKAVDLYTKYLNVPHEIQAAVDLLLSTPQPDALSHRLQNYTDEQNPEDS